MKIFLTVLFLLISVQSSTISNEPGDFEIEGISIGNSLLDFFTKDQIENEKNSEYVYV